MKREHIKQSLMKHEVSFPIVMGRLKLALGRATDSDLASDLGMSTANYANRKKLGSIPFELVIAAAISRSVSLDWLFGGLEPPTTNGRKLSLSGPRQTNTALLGTIVAELDAAFASRPPLAESARVQRTVAAARIGMLAGLMYDQVSEDRDDADRRQKIRATAQLLALVAEADLAGETPNDPPGGDTAADR